MFESYKRLCLALIGLLTVIQSTSQNLDAKVKNIISQQWSKASLPLTDIYQLKITDSYSDETTGLTYIYVQQNVGEIPIEHAVATIVLKNGDLVHSNMDRFIPHVLSKIDHSISQISGSDATLAALIHSENKMYLRSKPQLIQTLSPNNYIFKKTENVLENTPAQLVYRVTESSQLELFWKVNVHELNGNYWNNYIDAQTGNIAFRKNQTLSCGSTATPINPIHSPYLPFNPTVTAQYRAFPIPISAPNAGQSSVIVNPADAEASPLGWHDDGTIAYTITKGNNTHAFADPDSNYISANDEPKAAGDLTFDFKFNPEGTILQNKDAAIVNLFYITNVMHDFAYHYGLTESAGNFQTKNISTKGKGNDAVVALGQYGANSSRFRNNADFLSPADGSPGRMRMFIWNVAGNKLLKVTDPVSLSTTFETGTADFGAAVTTTAVTAKLVLVSDGSANPSFGCKTLKNATDIKGKIAVIDRGDCFFHEKACFAQAAGAIGVIICNYENTANSMGGISAAPCTVTIPVISIGSTDAVFIKKNIQSITCSIQKPATTGSPEKDGSFDNGIIAHEYGHGISGRLAGGPSNADCLNNDEQMGEGWSDFFTLVLTTSLSDNENTPKGVGTFVLQQESADRGIRKYPYTTDMSVNPQTYENVFTAEEHDLGAVWTSMLWDLYWKMSKTYGWDPDLYKGKGGNNKAIRLVFEGLKLQPCSPGFTDGRDAILKADQLLNKSENQCLIWEAFARRGLGFSAKQGSSNDKSDGIQAFDLPPSCLPTVKITKVVTPFIKPGEDITVNITVRNDTKADATNVLITDSIPLGAIFKAGSASVALIQNGNVLSYKVNVLGPGESIGLIYKLESSKSSFSKTISIDSMENSELFYDIFSLQGSGIWEVTDVLAHSGKKSWFVPNQATDNDQLLNPLKPFDLSAVKKPILRFFHRYKIQNAFDGGALRGSTDGGKTFSDIGNSNIFRNKYNGPISFQAIPIPGQRGFYGDSKSFIPTYVDLASFKNQAPLYLQFRFGSDDSGSSLGWFIDDLELIDMFNYNSQACVKYDGAASICAEAAEYGTIVESQIVSANKNVEAIPIQITLAPNPAQDQLSLRTKFPKAGEVHGEVYTIDGKLQRSFKYHSNGPNATYVLNIQDLPVSMYILTLKSGKYIGREKFVIER